MSVEMPIPHELLDKIEKSLAASRLEGVAAQVPGTIFDFFLVPFALFLGAKPAELGFLIALPSFLSALALFFVVDIVRWFGNRRRLIVWGSILQSVALAPLPLFAVFSLPRAVLVVFALISLFRVIGSVMGPPWGSLMSDYLPENRRGDYFGRRSQLIGICGLIIAAASGAMLHFFGELSQRLSFSLLLMVAFLARAVSVRYMRRMVDLPEIVRPRDPFDFRIVAARLRQSNFVRFVVYVSGISFSTQVAAAYFSVHMLKDLHFDFIPFTAVQLASAMMAFGAYPAWGRNADMVGNARVLRFTGFLMPIIPILWMLTERAWLLVLIEGASGFLWAGFNLCSGNFIYDAVPADKRVEALGWYNLINGAALFLGGVLGSLLADRLPAVTGYPLHSLFLVSAALRFLADFALSRHFKEVKATARRAGSAELFFSVVGVHPLGGANAEIEWDVPARLAKPGEKIR